MSEKNKDFLSGTIYIFLVAFFLLMFILGATASIWQVASKNNNGTTSSAFNYIAVEFDDAKLVFNKCDIEEVEIGELVLYNESAESGEVVLAYGKLKELRKDDNFGEIVVWDETNQKDVVRPITYYLGQFSDDNEFSFAVVSLLNDPIMFYLFTIFPALVLAFLILYKIHQTKQSKNK